MGIVSLQCTLSLEERNWRRFGFINIVYLLLILTLICGIRHRGNGTQYGALG